MYSNLELAIIVGNCQTMEELLEVCQTFQWLIASKYLKQSMLLNMLTNKKFSQLEKLNL